MRQAEEDSLGFELMRRPSDAYYRELPDRIGDQLTVCTMDQRFLLYFGQYLT